jgi:hypothetical protein
MKKLIIASVCLAAICVSSCRNKSPKACFSFSKTANVKLGDTITLVNCSTDYTDIEWTFPLNGTSKATTPRVKMNAWGPYTVSLKVGTDNFLKSNTEVLTIEVLP